jgi:hypothetical protein
VVSSTEVIQRAAVPAFQVEIHTTSATASTLDPSVGEECLQANLDMGVGEDSRRLDLNAARIPLKVMAAMWEVHWLWEILLTALMVLGYSEKRVIQKGLSHV